MAERRNRRSCHFIPLLVYSNDAMSAALSMLQLLIRRRRHTHVKVIEMCDISDYVLIPIMNKTDSFCSPGNFNPYFQLCFLITSLIIGSSQTEFIKRIEERTLIASSPKISYTVLPESIIA